MDTLLEQIEIAHGANLFYLSLFSALAVPDICGALSASDGAATGARYREWYDRYVTPRYDTLTGDEAYQFRCSALHQGTSEPNRPRDYERIMFLEPNQLSINVSRTTAAGRTAIVIDLKQLVSAIVSGARQFCADQRGSEPF